MLTLEASDFCIVTVENDHCVIASTILRGCLNPISLPCLIVEAFATQFEGVENINAVEWESPVLEGSTGVCSVVALDGVEEITDMVRKVGDVVVVCRDRDMASGECRILGYDDLLEGFDGCRRGTHDNILDICSGWVGGGRS